MFLKKKKKRSVAFRIMKWLFGLVGGVTTFSVFGGVIIMIMVIIMAVGFPERSKNTTVSLLTAETLGYTDAITDAAETYGIKEYVPILLAICNQESHGIGTNIFQISTGEEPETTDESIDRGVKYFSELLALVGYPDPKKDDDNPTEHLLLLTAIQCYNYGEGYYHYLDNTTNGRGIYYSEASAIEYQNKMLEEYPDGYGDSEYVAHVLQFWDPHTNSNKTTGSGSSDMVATALSQLDSSNDGGEKFWRYVGFTSYQPWCAAFVSWCADQCGYIDAGIMEFTALADPTFYIERNQYFEREEGYLPLPGDLVYFDWEQNDDIDHVGIVEYVESGYLYTIEGNSSDSVQQLTYDIHDPVIAGYACPTYFPVNNE